MRRGRPTGGGVRAAVALAFCVACAGGQPEAPPIPARPPIAADAVPPATAVPTPGAVLGFEPGAEAADGRLPDWSAITSYFAILATASPRVRVDTLGRTTLDRPYVLATISSPGTLAQLDAYRAVQQRLADPRQIDAEGEAERLVAVGRAVILLTAAARSDAIESVVAPLRLAHRLASGDGPFERAVLANAIILIVPSSNPDGLDRVVRWRDATRDRPWVGAHPPFPEHPFAGHDLAADVPGLTQVETRLMAERVVRAWHPHAVHVIGGSRLRRPAAGNRPPTSDDSLTPGRAAATATPWPAAFTPMADSAVEARPLALLRSAARNRERWLRRGIAAARTAVGGGPGEPDGWLIEGRGHDTAASTAPSAADRPGVGRTGAASDAVRPSRPGGRVEPAGVAELLRMLTAGGVEVRALARPYHVGGRAVEEGSYVVPARQPQVRFARIALRSAGVLGVDVVPFTPPDGDSGRLPLSPEPVAAPAVRRHAPGLSGAGAAAPRIAVYRSHAPSPDGGWIRWLLEAYRVPHATVEDADIRRGRLARRFDAIVLPDASPAAIYAGRPPGTVPADVAGGIGAEGTAALAEFVRAGGTLITLARASRYAIEHLGIPLSDRPLPDRSPIADPLRPGTWTGPATVPVELDAGHPLAVGMPGVVPVVAEHAFVLDPAHRAAGIVGRYADDGTSALVEVPMGRGRIVLFGFRPHYRGLAAAAVPSFFSALRTSGR